MWIEEKERDRIQKRLNNYLKTEVEENINYRFLVEDLVRVLDRKLAFVLIARLEGYSGVEIAACLGISSSTVTQYKKKLKKVITEILNNGK